MKRRRQQRYEIRDKAIKSKQPGGDSSTVKILTVTKLLLFLQLETENSILRLSSDIKLTFLVVYISTSAFDRLGHPVRFELPIVWEITQ